MPEDESFVTLLWNRVQDTEEYSIQVATMETFDISRKFLTPDTFITVDRIRDGRTYYWRVQANNVAGSGPWSNVLDFMVILTGIRGVEGVPTEYSISQNYPNPFNPNTKIEIALPIRAQTKVMIYDLLGREVMTLINQELNAGKYEINIDANNLPSGVYFYKIQSGDFIQTKKMILTK